MCFTANRPHVNASLAPHRWGKWVIFQYMYHPVLEVFWRDLLIHSKGNSVSPSEFSTGDRGIYKTRKENTPRRRINNSPLETQSFQRIASLDLNFSLRCFHNETMGKLATLELAEVSLRLEKHISKCRRSLSMIWFKFNYETGGSFVVEAGCLFLLEWIEQRFSLLSISICSN